MKYFSIFSGIGGFELGIHKAYSENESRDSTNSEESTSQHDRRAFCVGYSEINKYASSIYKYHYPLHRNYGDCTKINPSDLPDFDLLCGGFPCQAFSIAGKRMGFEDTRGNIFFEICRIAQVKRPRFLLLENVKGLLSHDNGRTFITILAALDELGYDAEWEVLNSKYFGVPQNRERVFIVGHLRGQRSEQVFPLGQINEKNNELCGQQNNTNTLTARYSQSVGEGSYIIEREQQTQGIKQLNNPSHSNDRLYSGAGLSPSLNKAIEIIRPKIFNAHFGRTGERGDGWSDIAFTMDSGVGRDQLVNSIRRLTPIECERLQGFPDSWTKYGLNEKGDIVEISDSMRYKCLGNAVTVNVVESILRKLNEVNLVGWVRTL